MSLIPIFQLGVIIFCFALILSLICLGIIRRYAQSWGLVDIPNERKVHSNIMPKGGGIGIILAVIISYLVCWLYTNYYPDDFKQVKEASTIFQKFGKDSITILIGGIIIFATGLIDDLKNLSPRTKLILESLVAFWLIYNDIRITVFIDNYLISCMITWFWIVLITNSFNLLDNMDGLSAGVAFISGIIFVIVSIQIGQFPIMLMLLGMLGAVAGFLCYNFPPASIFMGDSGSLFLGYMMAALTTHATFYQHQTIFSVGLPILVLAVPLFDTSTVILLRLRQGVSIFKADKQHFSHRLVNLGLSKRHAVFLIYLITFAVGLSTLFLYQLGLYYGVLVLIQILAILLVIHILERLGNNHRG